jgi:hypothetical protein
VLDKGRIVEQGPPEVLIAGDGLFAQLHKLQGEVRRRDRIAESMSGDDTEIDKTIRILRRETGNLGPQGNGKLSTTVRPDA